jgi:C-methyltransferase-like protein
MWQVDLGSVRRIPYKQGCFLPGTHIPIYPPARIAEARPDYILILRWNLKDEIMRQLTYAREWGAKFIVPTLVARILD